MKKKITIKKKKKENKGYPCTHEGCDFVAKNKAGLTQHVRIHTKKKLENEGRPTSYKGEETIAKTREYIDQCKIKATREEKTLSESSTTFDVKYVLENMPTVQGLSSYLGVHKSTVYLWMKNHKEFSDVIDDLKDKYEEILVIYGLSGHFNSKIASLLLSYKFGYKESKDFQIQTASDIFDDDE